MASHGTVSNGDPADLWAITSHFNPAGNRRRRENFQRFRRQLDVPLVAVELAYDDAPYELGEDDADILIQLRDGAVLFQKERLLNVAVKALPESCRKVAIVDADIVFASRDWTARLRAALDEHALVQPFHRLHHLPADWQGGTPDPAEAERSWRSVAFAIACGETPSDAMNPPVPLGPNTCALGAAWAVRRDILDRHGLFDEAIVGGGPRLAACAAYGTIDRVMDAQRMNDRQRERYVAWAQRFASDIKGSVSCIEGDVFHLWHGDLARRGYGTRFREFERFDFDPGSDITVGKNGAWQWGSDKPDLHHFLRSYFSSRDLGT
jgi:hypothetical protein